MWKVILLLPALAWAHPKCPLLVGDPQAMMPVYTPVFAPQGLKLNWSAEEWESLASEEQAEVLKQQFLALFRAGLLTGFKDLQAISISELEAHQIDMTETTVRTLASRAARFFSKKNSLEALGRFSGLEPHRLRSFVR